MSRSFGVAVVVLCVLSIAGGIDGQSNPNQITYPTQPLSLHYLDTVEVTYNSNISSPSLYTWCRSGEGNVQQKRLDHPGGFNGSASVELNFTVDIEVATCWFNIRVRNLSSTIGANGKAFQFNSTEGERKIFSLDSAPSSSSNTPTSTSTSTPSPSGVGTTPDVASTSALTPSPSQSASASASGSPGLSTGAQAGIGVGAGIVGVVIGAAVVAFVYRRRRKWGDGSGETTSSGSLQYPPTAGPPTKVSSSPQDPRLGYYEQGPNVMQAPQQPQQQLQQPFQQPFQDVSELERTYVTHKGPVEPDGVKYGGALPVPGARHEIDGIPVSPPQEMP
ncbi:hypothetical protein GGR54DRAFT_619885 [Hypoxylon sp. NC1633]|nr:hypothetical protein GGR54DRAFT_619885 [Hypoxylon sp. NC1633]